LRLIIGNRSWWVIVVVLAAAVAARGAPTHSLKPLIDAVIRNGPDSQLPAHLSVTIGVSQVEQTTAVKQAVARNGAVVRTFNVCVANHDDVVILTYDEQSRSTKAYLSSATGSLRKAVSYQAGAAATERTSAAAGGDFAKEVNFWVDFVKQQATPPQGPAAH
jgi:hypothetical protein